MKTPTLLLLFALLAVPGLPQEGGDAASVRQLRGKTGSIPITAFAWLQGSWFQEENGLEVEELWMSPKGGLMLGLNRSVHAETGRVSFEYLRIEAREDGIYYVASPGGKRATDFRLTEAAGRRVVFENAAHDFPQRISYWADQDDVLWARIEGRMGGEVRTIQWVFGRRSMDAERAQSGFGSGLERSSEDHSSHGH